MIHSINTDCKTQIHIKCIKVSKTWDQESDLWGIISKKHPPQKKDGTFIKRISFKSDIVENYPLRDLHHMAKGRKPQETHYM